MEAFIGRKVFEKEHVLTCDSVAQYFRRVMLLIAQGESSVNSDVMDLSFEYDLAYDSPERK